LRLLKKDRVRPVFCFAKIKYRDKMIFMENGGQKNDAPCKKCKRGIMIAAAIFCAVVIVAIWQIFAQYHTYAN